jgi:hypothetical protein
MSPYISERHGDGTHRPGPLDGRCGGSAAGGGLRCARADVARLSPFVRHHVNMLSRYSFQLPPGGLRPLREAGAGEFR